MKFWCLKRGNALHPIDDVSLAELDKLPFDKPLQIEATMPRNSKHHRLFFKLCARIAQGIGKDTEWVQDAFKVETGHFDIFSYGGKEHMVLRSIAFHKMDQLAFSQFFERCIQIMYERWHIDPASVADLLVKNEDQKHG